MQCTILFLKIYICSFHVLKCLNIKFYFVASFITFFLNCTKNNLNNYQPFSPSFSRLQITLPIFSFIKNISVSTLKMHYEIVSELTKYGFKVLFFSSWQIEYVYEKL